MSALTSAPIDGSRATTRAWSPSRSAVRSPAPISGAGLAAGQREVDAGLAARLRGGAGAVELHREDGLRVVRRQHAALPRQPIALEVGRVGAGLPRVAHAAVEKPRALVQLERGDVDGVGASPWP